MSTIPRLRPLTDVRCPKCNTLLYRARIGPGTWIQIRCKRCKELVERKAA